MPGRWSRRRSKRGLKIMTVGEQRRRHRLLGGAIDGFAQSIDDRACAGAAYKVRLPLVGAFQVENAAVAAGLAIATGSEPARVFAALEKLNGAKGRLELAGSAQRRADLHRLRAQAGRAGEGARGAAALCAAAGSSWCSAPAATATPASGR